VKHLFEVDEALHMVVHEAQRAANLWKVAHRMKEAVYLGVEDKRTVKTLCGIVGGRLRARFTWPAE
jgi:hypothetical protein